MTAAIVSIVTNNTNQGISPLFMCSVSHDFGLTRRRYPLKNEARARSRESRAMAVIAQGRWKTFIQIERVSQPELPNEGIRISQNAQSAPGISEHGVDAFSRSPLS
jgi:hypothetical protein